MAAYRAFQEPALLSDPLEIDGDFEDFEYRRLRYAMYWAFYENDAYREAHKWAAAYKQKFGLYRYTRNIFNPTYRIGEFWKAHLWGGPLDLDAGDGDEKPTALPILTASDGIREGLSNIWRWSNWQTNKDIFSLYGSVLGDVAVSVVDDTDRGKVYLKLIHPGAIKAATVDPFGNVKAYTIEETRRNPVKPDQLVTYREEAFRDNGNVVYQTFMNNVPFAWGDEAEWEEPYGFIPLVMIQHNNVGLDWGWSELHALRGKIHEVDDLASKLSDQVRKTVDAPVLFGGVDKPSSSPTTTETSLTGTAAVHRPQPGREEVPAFYGPIGATVTPIVSNLSIADTAKYIADILAEIERDHPELQMDIWQAGGDNSGRALRIARQRVETKVQQRRAGYDDALVRAQQMALSIGGLRGYEGFGGIGLDSFESGALEHSIGNRPVFHHDPLDDLEIRQLEASVQMQELAIETERAMRQSE